MRSLESHYRDRTLARRVLTGESRALEEFRERLRCVATFVTERNARFASPLNRQDLPDVIQQCLLVIWRKLDTFDGRSSLTTWIYRICVFELMNAMRRTRRTRVVTMSGADAELDEPSAMPESGLVEREGLLRALAELPPDLECVLRLKHFEDLSFAALAARLDITVSLAKARYYRGLRKMESALRRYREEGP